MYSVEYIQYIYISNFNSGDDLEYLWCCIRNDTSKLAYFQVQQFWWALYPALPPMFPINAAVTTSTATE